MTDFVRSSIGNIVGFTACVAMMGYALYAQHFLGLEPCPLCVLQRLAVIGLGVLFFVAAVHAAGPVARSIYAVLLALVALAGSAVAGRHVWLQNLPADQVPACGPGLDFMLDTFALGEVLEMVLSGSGECAEVKWSLFGLSMPAWTLVALLCLGIFGVWANYPAAKKSQLP